jgi:hypothetical protein
MKIFERRNTIPSITARYCEVKRMNNGLSVVLGCGAVLLCWIVMYGVGAIVAAQRGRVGVDLKPSNYLLHLRVSTFSM